jgi:LSD1 subclass zinc finger protein
MTTWLELLPGAQSVRPDCAMCNIQVVICIDLEEPMLTEEMLMVIQR